MSPSHPPPWSRRDFLAGGLGAAGLAAFVAACSSSGHKVINVPNPTSSPNQQLNLVAITDVVFSGSDQRVAFVLRSQDSFITPPANVTFAVGPDDKHLSPQPVEVHNDALGAPAYLSFRRTFTTPGYFVAQVGVDGKTAQAAFQAADPAKEPSPTPGQSIPSLATPTTTDLHSIPQAMLCTRTPQCPLHNLSLDVALKAGKPIALLFATPKYCQTQTCGPTLDVLLRQMPPYAGKIQFLHMEIYPSVPDFSSTAAPTTTYVVDAFKISSEPILYLVSADGKVQDRIDGLVGDAEVKAALDRLSA